MLLSGLPGRTHSALVFVSHDQRIRPSASAPCLLPRVNRAGFGAEAGMSALFGICVAQSAWNRRFTLRSSSLYRAVDLPAARHRAHPYRPARTFRPRSGTDLIVGARTGRVQLLLYSVFHIGAATQQYPAGAACRRSPQHPRVDWVVPISLGDSHRGFSVVATSPAYFEHFRYGNRQALGCARASASRLFDTVVGAEVAQARLHVGDKITLSHGDGGERSNEHGDKPFTVVGILRAPGLRSSHRAHQAVRDGGHPPRLDGGRPDAGVKLPADSSRSTTSRRRT